MASGFRRGFCGVCAEAIVSVVGSEANWMLGRFRLRSLSYGGQVAPRMTPRKFSKRLLLVPAFLAGEFHAGCAFFSRNAIWRAAFSASRLDPGIALLHDNGLARHGFANQALGLLPHRLLRHPPAPINRTEGAL